MDSNNAAIPKLVIFEAKDDMAFVKWIAEKSSVTGLEFGTVGNWKIEEELFAAYLKAPVFEAEIPTIVAIFDADDDPNHQREEIRSRLQELAPESKTIIYLLPNDEEKGELEDLFLSAARDEVLLGCADAYADCVHSQGYKKAKRAKLKYQAYAAPIRYEQRAIQKASFDDEIDFDHASIQKLSAFLRSLAE